MVKNKTKNFNKTTSFKKDFINDSFIETKEDELENFFSDTVFTTTANLRLRDGAGFTEPVLTVIPKGKEVIYHGYHQGDWYCVTYNDLVGFCFKEFLK